MSNILFPFGVNPYKYERLKTRSVYVGDVAIGSAHPIRVQTMTTTDTMDTQKTVEQSIRCIEAGSELVRITAPSKKDAENLMLIKNQLRSRGYTTPLVADIHYTPNAAEIAAEIVEKVRINPGNYLDKKKFETITHTDESYQEEIDKIYNRFKKLLDICKRNGTAIRIGTNHGSLSDRIMSRYGDTPIGMVESAMEFLRIARAENFHQIVLSMKSSNTRVMIHAYRLLVRTMQEQFGECYPLHLGITEAGDGNDGRTKSAIGIGGLLEDGIGDTIRVSLTEEPELEIPVCKSIIAQLPAPNDAVYPTENTNFHFIKDFFDFNRRSTNTIDNIGSKCVPIVLADLTHIHAPHYKDLESIGYTYDKNSDKWTFNDMAADAILVSDTFASKPLPSLPTTLKLIIDKDAWQQNRSTLGNNYFPISDLTNYQNSHQELNFIRINCADSPEILVALKALKEDHTICLLVSTSNTNNYIQDVRQFCAWLKKEDLVFPIILTSHPKQTTAEENTLIYHSMKLGGLLVDGIGDGICLSSPKDKNTLEDIKTLNHLAFGILQGTRTRISKTEYISCPSCGRTLFDLQSTTQKIRNATHHLKGLKIGVMGCIVNGPGEMADADYGYVGSGTDKISLYKGKEVVKKNIPSNIAVEELINLIKDNNQWKNPNF